jgi:hypothetical protein
VPDGQRRLRPPPAEARSPPRPRSRTSPTACCAQRSPDAMAAIDSLLRLMLEKGGSDLHLTVGLPPKARASGALTLIGDQPIEAARDGGRCSSEICPERRWQDFLERKDLDLAHEIPGVARFRGNYLYNHWGQAAVFRQIPAKILSFDSAQPPRGAEEALPPRPGPRRRHRPHRLRQVDHARGDDRLHQHNLAPPHHHHRGPHRVRAPEQESP